MDFGPACSLLDVRVCRTFLAEPNIFPDRHVEKHVFLEHHRHASAQRLPGDFADIYAVDGEAAFIRQIEPQDQVEQRTLARTAGADNGDGLADVELETEIVENR